MTLCQRIELIWESQLLLKLNRESYLLTVDIIMSLCQNPS